MDPEITEEKKRRAQKNKERALALKEQRRRAKPYDRQEAHATPSSSRDPLPAARNSYAGFMYEEEDLVKQHRYRLVEEDGKLLISCTA